VHSEPIFSGFWSRWKKKFVSDVGETHAREKGIAASCAKKIICCALFFLFLKGLFCLLATLPAVVNGG